MMNIVGIVMTVGYFVWLMVVAVKSKNNRRLTYNGSRLVGE